MADLDLEALEELMKVIYIHQMILSKKRKSPNQEDSPQPQLLQLTSFLESVTEVIADRKKDPLDLDHLTEITKKSGLTNISISTRSTGIRLHRVGVKNARRRVAMSNLLRTRSKDRRRPFESKSRRRVSN